MNHLKPTGTSNERRPTPLTTRSTSALSSTTVFPTVAWLSPSGTGTEEIANRDGEEVIGIEQPGGAVTIPWRSGVRIGGKGDIEASLLSRTSAGHGPGLEQSILILPS